MTEAHPLIRPRTLVPILLLASTPVLAHETPPPDDEAPQQLIELRAELFEAGREQALAQTARARSISAVPTS